MSCKHTTAKDEMTSTAGIAGTNEPIEVKECGCEGHDEVDEILKTEEHINNLIENITREWQKRS